MKKWQALEKEKLTKAKDEKQKSKKEVRTSWSFSGETTDDLARAKAGTERQKGKKEIKTKGDMGRERNVKSDDDVEVTVVKTTGTGLDQLKADTGIVKQEGQPASNYQWYSDRRSKTGPSTEISSAAVQEVKASSWQQQYEEFPIAPLPYDFSQPRFRFKSRHSESDSDKETVDKASAPKREFKLPMSSIGPRRARSVSVSSEERNKIESDSTLPKKDNLHVSQKAMQIIDNILGKKSTPSPKAQPTPNSSRTTSTESVGDKPQKAYPMASAQNLDDERRRSIISAAKTLCQSVRVQRQNFRLAQEESDWRNRRQNQRMTSQKLASAEFGGEINIFEIPQHGRQLHPRGVNRFEPRHHHWENSFPRTYRPRNRSPVGNGPLMPFQWNPRLSINPDMRYPLPALVTDTPQSSRNHDMGGLPSQDTHQRHTPHGQRPTVPAFSQPNTLRNSNVQQSLQSDVQQNMPPNLQQGVESNAEIRSRNEAGNVSSSTGQSDEARPSTSTGHSKPLVLPKAVKEALSKQMRMHSSSQHIGRDSLVKLINAPRSRKEQIQVFDHRVY